MISRLGLVVEYLRPARPGIWIKSPDSPSPPRRKREVEDEMFKK
jgi:hypothetical protein